jgi:hypothetical protein
MELTVQCPSDMLIGKLDKIEDLTVCLSTEGV